MRKAAFILVLLAFATAMAAAQRDKSKRPSPPGTAECKFADGKRVSIDYSRPRIQDPNTGANRKIYGGLVPWGEVWRTGANEATTFVTDSALEVGGSSVPAGNYTLFTIPSQTQWKLIISKKTGEWGIPYPEGQDLARINMKSEKLPSTVEQFTISFAPKGPGACTLNLDWENMRASAEVAEKK